MRIPPNSELDAVDPLSHENRAKLPTDFTPEQIADIYMRQLAYGDDGELKPLADIVDKKE